MYSSAKWRRALHLLLFALFSATLSCQDSEDASGSSNSAHEKFLQHGHAIKNSHKLVLFSLHPRPFQPDPDDDLSQIFHEYKIMGSIELPGDPHSEHVWEDLHHRVKLSPHSDLSKCFNPRHGIRAYHGTDEYTDYLICFECDQIYVYNHAAAANATAINMGKSTRPLHLNALLDKHDIPRDIPALID